MLDYANKDWHRTAATLSERSAVKLVAEEMLLEVKQKRERKRGKERYRDRERDRERGGEKERVRKEREKERGRERNRDRRVWYFKGICNMKQIGLVTLLYSKEPRIYSHKKYCMRGSESVWNP